MPHMVYNSAPRYFLEPLLWGTRALAPSSARTSGITQPPMLAIAVEKVAHKLPVSERQLFTQDMLPSIIRFHDWIYRERDPKNTGLAVCLHSWESGLDDTPHWTEAMAHLPAVPWYWRWLREYRVVNPDERAAPRDLQHMLSLARILRHYRYDSRQIIQHSSVVLQDLVFNSILAAANESLERLAESVGQSVPRELRARFAPTRQALEELWDAPSAQYYTRDYRTGQLIVEPTIATFMPLFAGTASPARAEHLRRLLAPGGGYTTAHRLPTVPATSPHFEPQRFWRGPVWVSTNWFAILGLERYGFTREAAQLRRATLDLVGRSGFREYYHAHTGEGLGAVEFSWSAALALDLLARG